MRLITFICAGLGFEPSFHKNRDQMLAGHKAVSRSPNFFMLYNDFSVLLIEGLEYVLDAFQFNFMTTVQITLFSRNFHDRFDDLAAGSDDLLGSIGFRWW